MAQEQILALVVSSGVIGAFLSPAITFLKNVFKLNTGESTPTKRRLKLFLSILTSIGGGILVLVMTSSISGTTIENLLMSIGLCFTSATIVYNVYWKDMEN